MSNLRDRQADPVDESTSVSTPVRPFSNTSPFHLVKALFLVAAFASLVFSVGLWFSGAREEGVFVGLWVPAIHSLGTLILTGERERIEGSSS